MSVTRSSSTRTSPISAAGPTRTLSQPGGSPASCSSSASRSAESGVCDAGLRRRAPGCERGGDLVRDEVQREVERADRPDDPDRDTLREGELALAGLGGVHRHHLACERARLDRRHRERRHRARDLDAGRLQRLAGLRGDLARDLVGPLAKGARDADEDLRPLVRRERVSHRALGGVDGGARLCGARLRDTGDERAVVGRGDLDPFARLDPLAVEEQLPFGRRRRGHGESTPAAARLPGWTRGAPRTRSVRRRPSPSSRGRPAPMLDRLREREPVSWLPALDGWLVTRRDLALAVMRDAEDVHRRRPALLDGAGRRAEHAVARRRGARATSRAVLARVPPGAGARAVHGVRRGGASACSRRIAAAGRPISAQLSGPLSVAAMAAALGLDDLPADVPLSWYGAIVGAVTDITGRRRAVAGGAAFAALGRCPGSRARTGAGRRRCSARRPRSGRARPRRGRLERRGPALRRDRDDRRDDRERALARPVERPRAGGARGSSGARRERRRGVAAARAGGRGRRPLRDADVELGGATIGRRELVRVSLSAANRDPSVFAEPHRFVPDRENARLQAAFAHGPHVCLGMHLARLGGPGRARASRWSGLPGFGSTPAATARRRVSSSASRPSCGCCGRPRRWYRDPHDRRTHHRRRPHPDRPPERRPRRGSRRGARRADPERARLASRRRSGEIEDVQMGCVSQVGEQAWKRRAHVGPGRGSWPGDGVRHVDRPPVRLVDAGGVQRVVRDPGGHLDVVVAVGRRVDVARADGIESHGNRLRRVLAEALRALGGRAAGHLRRGHRRRVGPLARGSRRVLLRVRHRRAIAAIDEGRFEREIVPVETGAGGAAVLVAVDENPAATRRSRSSRRSSPRSRRTARSPRATRARSSTAPPRCS